MRRGVIAVGAAVLACLVSSCALGKIFAEQWEMMRHWDEDELVLLGYRTSAHGFVADFYTTSRIVAFLDQARDTHVEVPFLRQVVGADLERIAIESDLTPHQEIWICVRNTDGYYYFASPYVGEAYDLTDQEWGSLVAGAVAAP